MKTIYTLILFASVQTMFAQPFTIKSYTIGAPGGSSATKAHTIKGTVGAHDALDYTGRFFAIGGGFWEIAAAPGGPRLRIDAGGRTVTVAWPDPSTGFQLQQTKALSPASWTDVITTPRIVGSEKQVVLPIEPGSQFFRLRNANSR